MHYHLRLVVVVVISGLVKSYFCVTTAGCYVKVSILPKSTCKLNMSLFSAIKICNTLGKQTSRLVKVTPIKNVPLHRKISTNPVLFQEQKSSDNQQSTKSKFRGV